MKRYIPNDRFNNAYLDALDGDEQLPEQPVYLCSDVEELVAAARAVVDAYQEEIPGVGEMSTEAIDRLRRALP